jgi:sortase (surface protein transpeptidase)
MSKPRSLTILMISLLALAAVLAAWAWWPSGSGRADLVEVAPRSSASSAPARPAPPPTSPPSTTPTTLAPLRTPNRLVIPAIGVEAPVVPVGLAPDGAMEIPPATEVGWYRLGPSPGAQGSAVLAGHIDFNGERGAFFDLMAIPVGAEVLVEGDGPSLRFVVTAREQIPKAEVDLARYFTHDGPHRLTLITCGGAFDRGAGRYQDNIVITATLQPAG